MRRREFLALVSGAWIWPLGAMAQDGKRTYHLGICGRYFPKGK